MSPDVSPRFRAYVANAIAHWTAQTATVDDRNIAALNDSRHAILRAARFGLNLPETADATGALLTQCRKLIDYQAYWDEWIPLLRQALDCAVDPRLRVELRYQLGFFHRLQGDIPQALALHQTAAAEAESLHDDWLLALVLYDLAHDYLDANRPADARPIAERAKALFASFSQTGDGQRAAINQLLGAVELGEGRAGEARARLEVATALWRSLGERNYEARCRHNLAKACELEERWQEALEHYEAAMAILARLGHELDWANAALNRGLVFYRQDHWAAALEAFRLADTVAVRRSGRLALQASISTNIGDTCLRLGDLATAEAYLRDAVHLWRRQGNALYLANAVGTLGETLEALGRRVEAVTSLDEALALLEPYREHIWGSKLWRGFGAVRARLATQASA